MYSIEQTMELARSAEPSISYRLTFPEAAQHLVRVVLTFDSDGSSCALVYPAWVPGSYKIRDFVTNQGNLTIRDESGAAVSFSWVSANRLELSDHPAGRVSVEYNYFAAERSVRHSHVDRWHAFLNPGNILMYVDGRQSEVIELSIEHDWEEITTALHQVGEENRFVALNFDILVDSPIEIGDHKILRFDVDGIPHEIALTGAIPFDDEWILSVCRRVVEQGVSFWRTMPYDRYIFFLQFLPGLYGGLEHANSQVDQFDDAAFSDATKVRKFLSLLTHEYFHTWNVKRIRPVELGPFDYEKENYSSMLWLAEGATSYYDDLISYRTGFYSESEYLKTLSNNHLQALLDVPGRLATSIKESSFLAWVKLYNPTADSGNRFPSYYLKGGVLFLLLDLHIIAETDGEHSLEEGMRALYDRYLAEPARGVDESEFLEIVGTATTVDIREIFSAWLDDTEEVDFAPLFESVGLLWEEHQPKVEAVGPSVNLPQRRVSWSGIATRQEDGGIVVAKVLDRSPAADAGLGSGDRILAVNGRMIDSASTLKLALQSAERDKPVALICSSGGRTYTTELSAVERPRMRLQPDPDADDRQIARRQVWLKGTG